VHRGISNVTTFNYFELAYYGKLDQRYVPFYLDGSNNTAFGVIAKPYSDGNQPMKVANFVADIFNEMARVFNQSAGVGKISKNEKYLSQLKVYRAYEDPIIGYNNYINLIGQKLRSIFIKKSIKVENFDHFMKEMQVVMPEIAKRFPLTLSGYIKSKHSTIFSSGLALELADIDYENDHEKIVNFYNSKNWDFFVQACNNYGFRIDRNIPWRIVCDIEADGVVDFIASRGYIAAGDFLSRGTASGVAGSIKELPRILLRIYNIVRFNRFSETVRCDDGTIKQVAKTSQTYSQSNFISEANLSVTYFAREYIKLRLIEENIDITQKRKEMLIRDLIKLSLDNRSFFPIERLFEEKINNLVDKKFTFNYYKYVKEPARVMREFDRGEISSYSMGNSNSSTGY
tara:strand:+ start:67 stop:1266 length:1200 start_codon:yes stop_codon:yes gene_type:complete